MRWVTSGPGWRLARSLGRLGRQLSVIWPEGGPTDGTVGDLSHQARRSDHNPNALGVVRALDAAEVIEDLGAALVAALVASRDPRILYIIHEGQIWRSYPRSGTTPWEPSPYTGTNQHAGHVHLSVVTDPALYDDETAWDLTGLPAGGLPMAAITVEQLQEALNAAGQTDMNGDVLVVDNGYGPKTQSAWVKGLAGGATGVSHGHTGYALIDHKHTITGRTT